MDDRCFVADLKHGIELVCCKQADPLPADAQRGGIVVAFQVVDVKLLLVDDGAVIVGADVFRLGHHHDTEFEAYANLHLVLDAETQFQGDVDSVGVDFGAFEGLVFAV